jgi:hypothetical protein
MQDILNKIPLEIVLIDLLSLLSNYLLTGKGKTIISPNL